MVPPSHAAVSTNWKPGSEGLNSIQMNSETTKVTSVVHREIQKMLRRAASSSPLIRRTSSAPSVGRKVTTERMGQVIMGPPSQCEQHVRDQRRDADQHGKGIVVEVARLQLHHAVGHIHHAGGDAIRAEAVDEPAVALLPEEAAEPLRRADEENVVDLVEVPLVEE